MKYKYNVLETARLEKGFKIEDLGVTKKEWNEMLENEIQPELEKYFNICDTLEVNIFDTWI